jgi:hypothetical protein
MQNPIHYHCGVGCLYTNGGHFHAVSRQNARPLVDTQVSTWSASCSHDPVKNFFHSVDSWGSKESLEHLLGKALACRIYH